MALRLDPQLVYFYVSDACNAFREIHRSNQFIGEVTNIGTGSSVSVSYVAKTIMELMGCSLNIEEDSSRVRPHSSEISELLADNTKLISRTDWQPKYDLKRGLSETIEWHKVPEHREYYIDKNYVV